MPSDFYSSIPQGRFTVDVAPVDVRMNFIRKVYSLFLLSLLTTAGTTVVILNNAAASQAAARYGFVWLILYLVLAFGANAIARQGEVFGYILLALFSVITGIFFGPLIRAYVEMGGIDLVYQALGLTVAMFGGLTGYVFLTKKDFSFLAGGLYMMLFLLIGVGILSIFVPFSAGASFLFSLVGAIVFCGFVLYDTSNIMHRYQPEQFAVATLMIYLDFINLFLYILRLLSSRRD